MELPQLKLRGTETDGPGHTLLKYGFVNQITVVYFSHSIAELRKKLDTSIGLKKEIISNITYRV